MPVLLTPEQVIALAPDDASAKAGRGLASISKWISAGCDERAVWGECKGSGKQPYQVSIELLEPAFKCSCPSRKFPCKHTLGLFLLYAGNQLNSSNQPLFCSEWLAKRAQTDERKKEKTEAELAPEAAAKRERAKTKRADGRSFSANSAAASTDFFDVSPAGTSPNRKQNQKRNRRRHSNG